MLIEKVAGRRMLSPFAGCVKEQDQTRRGGQSSLGPLKSGYEAATPIFTIFLRQRIFMATFVFLYPALT